MTSTLLIASFVLGSVDAAPLPALSVGDLTIDMSALTQPEPAAEPAAGPETAAEPEPAPIGYGFAGSHWLTFGAAYATDFGDSNDFNLHGAWSTFVADSLEFGVEAAAWWFDQKGDDTGGLSASMLLRWHFLHDDDYSWTFFGDVGIGMLGAFDLVPDGGTGFNFLPRAGIGFTQALNDSAAAPRLMLGLRYHHISNGRIEGDSRNPARDGLMFYAAIVFPF